MAPSQLYLLNKCGYTIYVKIDGNNPFNNIWIVGEAIHSTFTENIMTQVELNGTSINCTNCHCNTK